MKAGEGRETNGKADGDAKKQASPEPMSTDAWKKELADITGGLKSSPEVPKGPARRATPPPGGFKVPPLPTEGKKPAHAPAQPEKKKAASLPVTRPSKPPSSEKSAAKPLSGLKTAGETPSKGAAAALPEDKKKPLAGKPAQQPSAQSKFSKIRLAISAALFVVIGISVAAGYHFHNKRGVEYYIERLRSENVAVQNHASEALKEMGTAAVPSLEQLIGEGNEREVLASAKTLGKIDTGESNAVLRTLTTHENPEVRRIALFVLGERAAPETFDNVVRQLESSDQNTRSWAIQALAGYAPKKSVPVLLGLLDDNNWRVQNTAAKTLQAITGQKLGVPKSSYSPELNKQIRDKWQKWWEENRDTFKRLEPSKDKGC